MLLDIQHEVSETWSQFSLMFFMLKTENLWVGFVESRNLIYSIGSPHQIQNFKFPMNSVSYVIEKRIWGGNVTRTNIAVINRVTKNNNENSW